MKPKKDSDGENPDLESDESSPTVEGSKKRLIDSDSKPPDSYIPKTERLLAIYDMLTNISFPRKGKGKSTKPKILDAIVMAATDLKLKLQGAYDV